MSKQITPGAISAQIAKGTFRPHTALSNMALAYYQNDADSFAKTMFPICPVQQSSGNYYVFDKEDLLRDNWQRKPAYGKVAPAVLSEHMESYTVSVDQMIMGIDQIRTTDMNRRMAPATADQRVQRVRAIASQANIHQDLLFADEFLKTGVWGNEYEGNGSGDKKFTKFSDANSDVLGFFDQLKTDMRKETGREMNRIGFGLNVFNALKQHPQILERIKYSGSSVNPATVTVNVLAQLLEVPHVTVQRSIYNSAKLGQNAAMQFIGDPNSVLCCYAPDAPSIEEPSAGYVLTWDMLGDGNIMPILNYEGEGGTHSEFIEGLMATTMKKTANDLAVFLHNAV